MTELKPYPKYKDSGVEWIGDVPDKWKLVKLKYLCKINTGSRDTQDKVDKGEYPFFVRSDSVERINEYTHDTEAVMTAGDGVGVGKVFHYYKGKFSAHQRVYLFTNYNKIVGKFLYYYLSSNLIFEVQQGTAKSTVDSLRRNMLSHFLISLPDEVSQKRIVQFIDEKTSQIDSLIAAKERLIELLEEKRQAVITETVTKGLDPNVKMKDSGIEWIGEIPEHWEVAPIKWLSSVKRGASPRPIDDPKYFDDHGEYSWVRIADVSRADMYLESTTQRLSEEGSKYSVKLHPGALFISIAGSVGKPCITNIKCCIHDGFVYLPDYKESIKYLYFIFKSGRPYLGLGKLGTQLNLNTETIGSIRIPLPPKQEQKIITEFIEEKLGEITNLLTDIRKSIKKLKEYRESLIYEAVTGKIDLRDYEVDLTEI